MVVVPAATAVTIPVAASIVATDRSDDVHAVGDAAVVVAESAEVEPTQADKVPEMVGAVYTLNVAVVVQPLVFMYVMVVDPAAAEVTTPAEVIVATEVLDDAHGVEG
jgi:hypothetical protein